MLSLTCKIAIKAVIFLSSKSDNGLKASIKEVAESINASEHTTGKILQKLAKNHRINSLKGPSGGFFLDEDQQEQPIISIIETIEGEGIFKGCGLGLSQCLKSHPCPIHDEYKVARDLMEKIFRENKIRALCDSVDRGIAHLVG